jgi:predicted nucleotidyltransferase
MKIIGIICEYNPLHNGHVLHFNSIPKENDDIVIAVISGNVVNRGEISVINKFDKTSLALLLGVNIVIELPSVYAIQSSDTFSKRAIEILSYIGVSDIYFGSESNDIKAIDKYYKYTTTSLYNNILKSFMQNGDSYKSASINALKKAGFSSLGPNDMLGIGYYKAVCENNFPIELHTVKRDGNYSSAFNEGSITSATSIRLNPTSVSFTCPKYTYDLYSQKGFIDTTKIFNYLKVLILSHNMNNIFLIDEGFENAITSIYKYDSYDKYLESLNTKRYSISKISRIMLCILFNITWDDMDVINKMPISFVRILGYDDLGLSYIKSIKKDKVLYTNIKEGLNPIIDIELRISKILDSIYNLNLLELEQSSPIKKSK